MDKLKFICIHGHFYQPPRENAFSGVIEDQPSALPYHNWNERINKECYASNAHSPILNDNQQVEEVINNYSLISFNFGPTLLSWMEKAAPDVYALILKADEASRKNFSGHGSAMAQAYNHMIMPLANEADKKTQVIWGIKDFEYRFNRKPEGMWLPETAVDTPTLEILAAHGIVFTVLSPNQATKVKKLRETHWHHVHESTLNTHYPYLCRLPSGKKINIFFYNGPVSAEVAFGELLRNGEWFAKRLLAEFDEKLKAESLVHIATDGETYGHHHVFGNMALSYALRHIQKNHLAKITNYGEFLARFPPKHEVVIKENSSWSCSHGVERWQSDCGCALDTRKLWNQKWRKPLRLSLNWLRDILMKIYLKNVGEYVRDPYLFRNEYIKVVLNPSAVPFSDFVYSFTKKKLSEDSLERLHDALEMQRFAMLMFTSCGWFFDDVSGIEARQIMQYAARAIAIAEKLQPRKIEDIFVRKLSKAKSNDKDTNGGFIYEQYARPSHHARR